MIEQLHGRWYDGSNVSRSLNKPAVRGSQDAVLILTRTGSIPYFFFRSDVEDDSLVCLESGDSSAKRQLIW